MCIFYKVAEKQFLIDRNELFREAGILALTKNKFSLSPFIGSWHGEFDPINRSYYYNFCRIGLNIFLEMLDVSIHEKDNRISFYLCVFELTPRVYSISQLQGIDGIQFAMTVQNRSKYMQLRLDDYKESPLFYLIFLPKHKLGRYYTRSGYIAELKKLKKLIKSDMENIDDFVFRWHEIHKPNVIEWSGNIIMKSS